ncbi:hypothetical protein JR065_15125 [Xanthomonas sp. AmX2]|uniref:hypothetical protein n=1 Tax=Xanthomonas sp. TaxID=29446 RepID=UPI00197E9429|nr:hypothetical protein [Xanthomonas sp.]MBN6151676.1 hypothetical protein [Xanthomonas sp.]
MHIASEKKYSGLGIGAFAVSLIAGAFMLALIVLSAFLVNYVPGSLDEEAPSAMLIGLLMFAAIIGELAAAAMGVGSLFQRDRKKLYGVLGLVFSVSGLLGILALIAFGLSRGA